MALRYLTKALTLASVALDSGVVQFQRVAADVAAFEACAPHAGAYPLDDQVTLQFGDCADDDYDGPTQRAASIDIFPEADVLDLETTELVQDFEEVFDTHLQALLGDRP